MTEPKKESTPERDAADNLLSGCGCAQDPFAALPPELRPKSKPRMGGLRNVTCPGCGLSYWTNRDTDLCKDCEKKGVKLLHTDARQEE